MRQSFPEWYSVHNWELPLFRGGDPSEKSDVSRIPSNKGSTWLGSWWLSSDSSHRWLDLLSLQGFRDSGLESGEGNGERKEVSKTPS